MAANEAERSGRGRNAQRLFKHRGWEKSTARVGAEHRQTKGSTSNRGMAQVRDIIILQRYPGGYQQSAQAAGCVTCIQSSGTGRGESGKYQTYIRGAARGVLTRLR